MIKKNNNMSDNIGASSTNLNVFLFENHSAYFIFFQRSPVALLKIVTLLYIIHNHSRKMGK